MLTMLDGLAGIGARTLSALAALGRAFVLLMTSVLRPVGPGAGFRLWLPELFSAGVLSLSIVAVSGLFIGMVLALQGYSILVDFGSEQSLGQLVSLTLLRELGPVVTALLFAGRAGSAITAEIGLMKATEQLSSLSMIGVDPVQRVVAPRFWSGVISMPLLAIVFSTLGVMGGYLVGVEWLGVDAGAFWGNMQASVDFRIDVVNGLIKAFVFGIFVTWIAVFQGMDLVPTAEGISRATTRTVVYGSLSVLALDFFLTAMMFGDF